MGQCVSCRQLTEPLQNEKGSAELEVTSSSSRINKTETSSGSPLMSLYGLKKRTVSTARLRKGEALWDKFEMTENILGTGISGEVRVVKEIKTGRQFAMKTLTLEKINAQKAAFLHNEVAVYLHLDHPNIAKLIEVYDNNSTIHLIMELCTGRELYDRLYMKKRYNERDAAKVAFQMLSAINYCHKHCICHRDLKLENWVYETEAEDAPLKLIDFGFSRLFNPGIPMTAMHGTVYYVSPEVMDGSYGEKCDLWSLGVIVYMLLSGTPPFNGSTDQEILLKIKKGSFVFQGPRWEGVSNEAKRFVCRLLQKNPAARPSAAESLKDEWLWIDKPGQHEIDHGVLVSLRQFAAENIIKRAALGLLAFSSNPAERKAVEKQFRALDYDHCGTIQIHQLVEVLRSKLNVSPEEAERIFRKLDQTGDKHVHYSEFMAATVHVRLLKDEKSIREAFAKFDIDNSGVISPQNLKATLGDSYDGVSVEEIIELWGQPGTNYITYEDFLEAMTV